MDEETDTPETWMGGAFAPPKDQAPEEWMGGAFAPPKDDTQVQAEENQRLKQQSISDIFADETNKHTDTFLKEGKLTQPDIAGRLTKDAPWMSPEDRAAAVSKFEQRLPTLRKQAQFERSYKALEAERKVPEERASGPGISPILPSTAIEAVKRYPAAGSLTGLASAGVKYQAAKRMEAGTDTEEDRRTIANMVLDQKEEQARNPTGFDKFLDTASYLPAFVTEWSMLGGVGGVSRKLATEALAKGYSKAGTTFLEDAAAKAATGRALSVAERLALTSVGAPAEGLARTIARPDVLAKKTLEGVTPQITPDEQGGYQIAPGKPLSTEAANALRGQFIENAVFSAGGPFEAKAGEKFIPRVLKGWGQGVLSAEASQELQHLGAGAPQGSALHRFAFAKDDKERQDALTDFGAQVAAFGGIEGLMHAYGRAKELAAGQKAKGKVVDPNDIYRQIAESEAPNWSRSDALREKATVAPETPPEAAPQPPAPTPAAEAPPAEVKPAEPQAAPPPTSGTPAPGASKYDEAITGRTSLLGKGNMPRKAKLVDGSVVHVAGGDIGGEYLTSTGDVIAADIIKEWQDSKGNTLWKRSEKPQAAPPVNVEPGAAFKEVTPEMEAAAREARDANNQYEAEKNRLAGMGPPETPRQTADRLEKAHNLVSANLDQYQRNLTKAEADQKMGLNKTEEIDFLQKKIKENRKKLGKLTGKPTPGSLRDHLEQARIAAAESEKPPPEPTHPLVAKGALESNKDAAQFEKDVQPIVDTLKGRSLANSKKLTGYLDKTYNLNPGDKEAMIEHAQSMKPTVAPVERGDFESREEAFNEAKLTERQKYVLHEVSLGRDMDDIASDEQMKNKDGTAMTRAGVEDHLDKALAKMPADFSIAKEQDAERARRGLNDIESGRGQVARGDISANPEEENARVQSRDAKLSATEKAVEEINGQIEELTNRLLRKKLTPKQMEELTNELNTLTARREAVWKDATGGPARPAAKAGGLPEDAASEGGAPGKSRGKKRKPAEPAAGRGGEPAGQAPEAAKVEGPQGAAPADTGHPPGEPAAAGPAGEPAAKSRGRKPGPGGGLKEMKPNTPEGVAEYLKSTQPTNRWGTQDPVPLSKMFEASGMTPEEFSDMTMQLMRDRDIRMIETGDYGRHSKEELATLRKIYGWREGTAGGLFADVELTDKGREKLPPAVEPAGGAGPGGGLKRRPGETEWIAAFSKKSDSLEVAARKFVTADGIEEIKHQTLRLGKSPEEVAVQMPWLKAEGKEAVKNYAQSLHDTLDARNVPPGDATEHGPAGAPEEVEPGVHFFFGGRVGRQAPNVPAKVPPPAQPPTTQAPLPATIKGRVYNLGRALKSIFNPAAVSEASKATAGNLRERMATEARLQGAAASALYEGKAELDKAIVAEKDPAVRTQKFLAFTDPYETGQTQNLPANHQAIASEIKRIKDEVTGELLSRGLLQSYIDNHLGHLWKDPRNPNAPPEQLAAQVMGKKSLYGTEGFKKQRVMPTWKDGIDAGLEPATWNPIEAELARLNEMYKAIAGHDAANEEHAQGRLPFVPLGKEGPAGYRRLEGKEGTVFSPGVTTDKEYFDKQQMEGLEKFATQNLGASLDRKRGGLGGAVGSQAPGDIKTAFGSPEMILAHEIGHEIDHQYPQLAQSLAGARTTAELEQLAQLRASGQPSPQLQAYLQSPPERIANLIAAYVHAPELLKQVAPQSHAILETLLAATPKLQDLRSIKPSLELGEREQAKRLAGPQLVGHYWSPEESALLIQRYLTPGIRGNPVYDAAMAVGNNMNKMNLGWSAYHALGTAINSQVTAMEVAFRQILSGKFNRSTARNLVEGVVPFSAVVDDFLRGSKLSKEWYKPGSQGAATAQMVEDLMKSGGRARMGSIYGFDAIEKFRQAIRQEAGVLPILGHGLLALNEAASYPIMQQLVPKAKMGAWSRMATHELANLGPNASPEQVRDVLHRQWQSVENRMGQMTYDNLFWNKTLRDVMHMGVRSVGWNAGDIGEFGGAVADIPSSARSLARGKGISSRLSYAIALPVVAGINGAIMQYLMTGQGPDELKDLFFPKTGATRHDGTPDRLSMPTYMKDAYSLTNRADEGPITVVKNMFRMAGGKTHPLWQTLAESGKNEDWSGTAISNPSDPFMTRVWDEAKHFLSAFLPISVSSFAGQKKQGASLTSQVLGLAGMTPAPAYITRTSEQQRAIEAGRKYVPSPLEKLRREKSKGMR